MGKASFKLGVRKELAMEGALSGIKVVGFTYAGTANMTMRILGMHGATVIRVESKSRPCNLRTGFPFRDNKPGLNRSGYYAMYNNDRYSFGLDLKHSKARQVLDRLIQWADVVVENFSPGTLDRLGLGYEAIRALKPDIIMLSISSQGQTGPHYLMPSYGPTLAAYVGHTHLCGWPDRGPCMIDQSFPDFIVPAFAAVALIAALDYKRRRGKGQYIDSSNVEPAVQWIAPVILDYTANKRVQTRTGNSVPNAAPHNAYPCKGEDSWCVIAVTSETEWANFCKVIGKVELANEPMFATLLDRKRNEAELDRIIEEWTVNLTASEVMDKMQAAGVPAGKVHSLQGVVEDRQLRHRGYFRILHHPEIGDYEALAPSYVLSRTPAELRLPFPCLGEHTEYVCRELLGMPEKEFIELLTDNVFE